MADFYLTQTGDEVQELLNTVAPTAEELASEIRERDSADDNLQEQIDNLSADAYRKPQAGIPAIDMTLGVQESLANANASIAVVGDKSYTPDEFSGLGRVNLEKNIQTIEGVEKNILTQDMFYKTVEGQRVPNTNTIFVIQYDYDLNDPNGENPITIPEGCVLKFDGGSISNGSIVSTYSIYINANKKVFSNVVLKGKVANDCVRLSWFCNRGDDAADVLTNLLSIEVAEVFLDLPLVQISHPIAPNNSYGSNYYTRKRICGLQGGLRLANKTTIIPTSNYSANGYERNSVLFFADTCFDMTINNINIEGGYKFGYFFYCKNYATVTIEKCYIVGCAISAIKLTGTEQTYIKNNNIHECGSFILAYPQAVNEANVLDMSGEAESDVVINLLKVEDNYVGESNYGIVAKIGSDIEINKNCISNLSCYALYIAGDRNINIFENYFEGCGSGRFWVNYNGKEESDDSSVICEHLLHPDGSSTEVGWGIPAFRGKLIRPIIYLASDYGLRKASCFISGNNFSCNYCRTTLDKNFEINGVNTVSINSTGIDCIFYFQNVSVTLNSTFVGPGHSDPNHIAKYFVAIKNGTSYDSNTDKIIIDYLPSVYRNVRGWCYGIIGYINNDIIILRQDREQTSVNYDTPVKVIENYNDSVATAKALSSVCPFKSVKDSINFYTIPINGNISYVIPFAPALDVVDFEDEIIEHFLYNPTNVNLYYYTKAYVVYGDSTAELIGNLSIMTFGNQNSPVVIKPKEKAKLTEFLDVFKITFISMASYVVINVFALEDSGNGKIPTNKLLISDIYKHNINCKPEYVINYNNDYDKFGRLIRGEGSLRPGNVEEGFQFFDTTLDKPIWNTLEPEYTFAVTDGGNVLSTTYKANSLIEGHMYRLHIYTDKPNGEFEVLFSEDNTTDEGVKLFDLEKTELKGGYYNYYYTYFTAPSQSTYPYIRVNYKFPGYGTRNFSFDAGTWVDATGTVVN